MRCPHCTYVNTSVIDSRRAVIENTYYNYRRRQCRKCLKRFTTVEVYVPNSKGMRDISTEFISWANRFAILRKSKGTTKE